MKTAISARHNYGQGVEQNDAEAVKLFREAFLKGNKAARSNLAWLLATSKDEKIRDGKQAVALAYEDCEANQWKNAKNLDILAAAYAEAGDFGQAAGYAQKAIQAADPAKEVDFAKIIMARWKLYENKQPWHRN